MCFNVVGRIVYGTKQFGVGSDQTELLSSSDINVGLVGSDWVKYSLRQLPSCVTLLGDPNLFYFQYKLHFECWLPED